MASISALPPPVSPWSLLLLAWAGAALVMALLWVRQLATRNATAVDVGWAAVLGAMAIFYAVAADGSPTQRLVAALLGGLWSGRLSWHLVRDRLGKEEDGRYRALRTYWGERAHLHFAWFYQLQALAALLLSTPFLLTASDPSAGLHGVQWIALVLVLGGVVGETTADRQLARFRADAANRGRTCREGLWRYSRHPNYFFEWVTWCGFGLLPWGAPGGALGLAAPVLMFVLIRYLSGIPHTEAQALRSRGEDYRRYQQATNAFFPWFPRTGGDAHQPC